MKKIKFLILALICVCLNFNAINAQTKVSVLGDSYSTFVGWMKPETNANWYGKPRPNDVKTVEQTWWYLLVKALDGELEVNNSWSGSTICHTGYSKKDFSDRSFVSRVHQLGNPDLIVIFGGTNDSWAGVPMGKDMYKKWTRQDLFNFRPAFCYLLSQLKQLYPQARIVNLTNCDLSKEVTESMDEICHRYKVTNVLLQKIDKQAGHPSIKGMQMICDQLMEHLN